MYASLYAVCVKSGTAGEMYLVRKLGLLPKRRHHDVMRQHSQSCRIFANAIPHRSEIGCNPREKLLRRKLEELPDQVMSADHPRNKRYGGLRLGFMIPCYQININLSPSSAPPFMLTPSPSISAVDIAMAVNSKMHLIFLPRTEP